MGKKNDKIIIHEGKEYVIDTCVLMSSMTNYADIMEEEDPDSRERNEKFQKVCFAIICDLSQSIIAIDSDGIILAEYYRKIFDKYKNGFAFLWFAKQQKRGNIVKKKVKLQAEHISHMRNDFGCSKTDTCLCYVAAYTNSKTLFHREEGLKNSAGYINKHFKIRQIHVMDYEDQYLDR